ncbi:MAG: type II secretion system protein [bacterium]|nr:type II secretion system protein [bacterium]
MNRTKGFSLMELLLVISLLGIAFGLVFWGFHGFFRTSVLDRASQEALSLVTEARERTLSRQDDVAWGVHLEAAQLVLFAGDAYSEGAADNKAYVLPQGVSITTITLGGGGTDIVFAKITGESSTPGFFELEQQGSLNVKTISINETGNVEVE